MPEKVRRLARILNWPSGFNTNTRAKDEKVNTRVVIHLAEMFMKFFLFDQKYLEV